MSAKSLLIIFLATTFGVIAMYLTVKYGMRASDDFAHKLTQENVELQMERQKAFLEQKGRDTTRVQTPEARSQKPVGYDESLTSADTSPYVRQDSDHVAKPASGDISIKEKAVDENGQPITTTNGEGQASGSTNVASGSNNASSGSNAVATGDELPTMSAEEEAAIKARTSDEGPYTVNDEIRRQLATEEMSDEKRAALEALLPQEKKQPVRAIDVRLEFDPNSCVVPRNSNSWIGVMFRPDSEAIRGSSLNDLDNMIRLRERCDGTFVIEDYLIAVAKDDPKLTESRRDEVRYYLLQRRVPKESITVLNR